MANSADPDQIAGAVWSCLVCLHKPLEFGVQTFKTHQKARKKILLYIIVILLLFFTYSIFPK